MVAEAVLTLPLSEAELKRYSRQILLREVGGRGQAEIRSARLLLDGKSALADLTETYLQRAGGTVKRTQLAAPSGFTVVEIASIREVSPETAGLLWAGCAGAHCLVGSGRAALEEEAARSPGAGLGGGIAFVTAASALSLLVILHVLGRAPVSVPARRWQLDGASGLLPVWDETSDYGTGSRP